MDFSFLELNDQFSNMNSRILLSENITAILIHTISKRDILPFLESTRIQLNEKGYRTGLIRKTVKQNQSQVEWVEPEIFVESIPIKPGVILSAIHVNALIQDVEVFNLSALFLDMGETIHPLLNFGNALTVIILDCDLTEDEISPFRPELLQADLLLVIDMHETSQSPAIKKLQEELEGQQSIIFSSHAYTQSDNLWISWLLTHMH